MGTTEQPAYTYFTHINQLTITKFSTHYIQYKKQYIPVSRKASLQPHTPGQALTKADTMMGPTMPAMALIVLPNVFKEVE